MLITFCLITILGVLFSELARYLKIPSILLLLFLGLLISPIQAMLPRDFVTLISTLSIIIILFDAGFHISWSILREVLVPSVKLATIGVVLCAALQATLMYKFLHFDLGLALIFSAIIAATDPASLFSIFRDVKMDIRTTTILEMESVINDPITIILVATIMHAAAFPELSAFEAFIEFLKLSAKGVIVGAILGISFPIILREMEREYSPLLSLGIALGSYSLAEIVGGSGFLAAFVSGLIIGNSEVPFKKIIENFDDEVAILMTILIFTLLGIEAKTSLLSSTHTILKSLLVALTLSLLVRPLIAILLLLPEKLEFREKLKIALIGPRGIVPAALALNLPEWMSKQVIINLVFVTIFVSITLSVLVIKISERRKA